MGGALMLMATAMFAAVAFFDGLPASQPASCEPLATVVTYLPMPEVEPVRPVIAATWTEWPALNADEQEDVAETSVSNDEPSNRHHRRYFRKHWRR